MVPLLLVSILLLLVIVPLLVANSINIFFGYNHYNRSTLAYNPLLLVTIPFLLVTTHV